MDEIEKRVIRHEIDAWDARRLELKRRYIAGGMPEESADDRATNEVRREIRNERGVQSPNKQSPT